MRVLVVDDEAFGRSRLLRLLRQLPQVEQAFECADPHKVEQYLAEQSIDLVLLDIEMPQRNGLAVAAAINQLATPPVVIFTTAHPEHALQAFKLNSADYLLKPVELADLEQSIAKVSRLNRLQQVHATNDTVPIPATLTTGAPRLVLKVGLQTLSLTMAELLLLQADEKYVRVVHEQGEALSEQSLRYFEQQCAGWLVRIHRHTLVPIARLRGIARNSEGNAVALLTGTEAQPEISRRELPRIRQLLESLTVPGTTSSD